MTDGGFDTLIPAGTDDGWGVLTVRGKKKKLIFVKSINRELKTRPTYDCRCDERLE